MENLDFVDAVMSPIDEITIVLERRIDIYTYHTQSRKVKLAEPKASQFQSRK